MLTMTIAEKVEGCLTLFNLLHSELVDRAGEDSLLITKAGDEFGRFKIWSGNIGAHRKGTSSLDCRLRDASHLTHRVMQLLGNLHEALDEGELVDESTFIYQDDLTSRLKATAIVSGNRPIWQNESGSDSESDSEEDSLSSDFPPDEEELLQVMSSISESISCLLRLSTAFRRPAAHDMFMKGGTVDTSYFEPHDMKHVQEKFPQAAEFIKQRLGKAISGRRQYLKYHERHRQKLGRGLEEGSVNGGLTTTVASSLPPELKSGSLLEDDADDPNSDGGNSPTSLATSKSASSRRRVPRLPKDCEYGECFECPFCFRMIVVDNRKSWK
jgi:hypothetical protein